MASHKPTIGGRPGGAKKGVCGVGWYGWRVVWCGVVWYGWRVVWCGVVGEGGGILGFGSRSSIDLIHNL